MIRLTYTLNDIEGPFDVSPDGSVRFEEEDGIDYATVTVQLSGGERVSFLFTVKQLVASGKPDSFGREFLAPSYRGSSFLDPKGRGGSTRYDNAVVLSAGGRGDEEELAKENIKLTSASTGKISLSVTKSKPDTSELIGVFESIQPSENTEEDDGYEGVGEEEEEEEEGDGNFSHAYMFEIGRGMLGLYLNFRGDDKYSYWEHKLLSNQSITYAVLGSRGLKLFDRNSRKIGQILANRGDRPEPEPVRYLALGGTKNLDLYYYSTERTASWSPYRAIDSPCDLPLPCGPYQVCTYSSSNGNFCLALPNNQMNFTGFCDGSYGSGTTQMVELDHVDTVLKTTKSPRTDLSKEECAGSCMEACSCSAALYSRGRCSHYGIVGGAQQVGGGNECSSSYWVKVSKEGGGHCGMSSSLMNKMLLFGEVVDVLAITLILGGLESSKVEGELGT